MASPLVLCADGGGSKVCVVIRSADGLEVRGTAGPCNVQSVGHESGAQAILLATYRALSLLPHTHLPPNLVIPIIPTPPSTSALQTQLQVPKSSPNMPTVSGPATPLASRPTSPSPSRRNSLLPSLNVPVFRYAWLALAGISTRFDAEAFIPHAMAVLNLPADRIKVTNDVNLLAAPTFDMPNIKHVVAVVCGTGTVGRTIRVAHEQGEGLKQLPLEDVAVCEGWGYILGDEGSAFWLGRLAIRLLLSHADRHASVSIHATPPPALLPLHRDLLTYFGTEDMMDLIEISSLSGRWAAEVPGGLGEIVARRNALVAGAARVVLRWAFPEDALDIPPTPPTSSNGSPTTEVDDPIAMSHSAALKLAKISIEPLIDLALDGLGDGSIVKQEETALALGGGLMMSRGYRGLLLQGLKKKGVSWALVQVIDDAAGAGAAGLHSIEFGSR